MKRALFLILGLAGVTYGTPSHAHSLAHLENTLHNQERFAQFVDYAAPAFQLLDANNRPVSLADHGGKVVVLNFVYLRCGDVCPLHMQLIARSQSMVAAAHMQDQVVFITIATDAEDAATTRNIMETYGKPFGLDGKNWQLLYRTPNQPPEHTINLAEQYGLKFTQAGESKQMHGVVTHVIDQTGRMRARFHGLKFDTVNLVSYLNALVNDDHSKSEEAQ